MAPHIKLMLVSHFDFWESHKYTKFITSNRNYSDDPFFSSQQPCVQTKKAEEQISQNIFNSKRMCNKSLIFLLYD